MAHEILSLKLCQLDERVGRLHSRIHLSETAGPGRLEQEISALERECLDEEAALRDSLRRSKSELISVLAQGCAQVEQDITQSRGQMSQVLEKSPDGETAMEERLLLAEYLLDFAHWAADHALLFSMKAIQAQLTQEKGESQ